MQCTHSIPLLLDVCNCTRKVSIVQEYWSVHVAVSIELVQSFLHFVVLKFVTHSNQTLDQNTGSMSLDPRSINDQVLIEHMHTAEC